MIREMSLRAKRALACIAGDRPFFPQLVDRDGSTGEGKTENRGKKGKGKNVS